MVSARLLPPKRAAHQKGATRSLGELHAKSTALHQQAGRAYARLKSSLDGETYEPQSKAQVGSGRGFNVVVFGTVNPKPDAKLALDAVRMLAEEMRVDGEKEYDKK